MMKYVIKSKVFLILICGIVFTSIGVYAATTYKASDVVYNASDGTSTNVESALNALYEIKKYAVPSDTYFYNSSTSGESIVRYKKVDGKYYLCDKNGIITNETEQNINNIKLVEYKATTDNYLSIGNAGYATGNLILGNNNDNLNNVSLEVSSLSYSNPFVITGLKNGDLIRASISNNYWNTIIYMYINNISGAEIISKTINDTTTASNATLYLRATSSTVKFTIGCDSRYQSWNPMQLILAKHK